LRFATWTQDEFRNLLCGLPPRPLDDTPLPDDMPVPTRQQTDAAFVANERRRLDADRHIQDAILAGHLKVLYPPDERLVEKIAPYVTPEELVGLTRAVALERSVAKAYRVAPDVAIRWAASRRDLFPDFAFDDPKPLGGPSNAAGISKALKAHRRIVMRQALERLGVERTEFFKQHKIGEGTIRGFINGERRRCGRAKEELLLKLLGITEREWNTLL
jgi:hypothetical protein